MAPDASSADRVRAAVDELYLDSPDAFVARRGELAKAARAAGDRPGATAIAALARPTRAAWVVNRLARTDPDVVDALLELGGELRAAQQELSADSLRELSDRRRSLVRDVAQRAFALAGIDRPPTGLADEVQTTLNAAVIDADVGAALQTATLLRATQASGFGPAGPALAVVPAGTTKPASAPPGHERSRTSKKPASAGTQHSGAQHSGTTTSGPTRRADTATARADAAATAAATKAKREQQQREEREARRERAQQALSTAREALDAARTAESDRRERVRVLNEQVRAAERDLGDAGLAVREAKAALRTAERGLRNTP